MVGSDHDLQWPNGYIQTMDHTAFRQIEVIVGSDRVVRVNVDGICALRVRMQDGSKFTIDDRSQGIEPTCNDIGRAVIYTGNRYPGGQLEQGVVTSFNKVAVFVRYGADRHSKATSREDLEWET